jgi:hypothetical protein
MDKQEIWIIGTEPPCPRCDYLTRMVKDVVNDLRLSVSVRHLDYTGEEARQFATACGLEPGTAKDVARKLAVDIDWEKVHAVIGEPDPMNSASREESCCPTIAARWSPELDELLRPCETKSREAGIMMTPVLVVGGRCVHQGSVPTREQVVQWISDFCGGLTEANQYNRMVEVLGPGCAKCDQLYQNVLEAVAHHDLHESVTVKKRTDLGYFQRMGVTVTPALVINGQVRSKGMVLTADQIVELLQKEPG